MFKIKFARASCNYTFNTQTLIVKAHHMLFYVKNLIEGRFAGTDATKLSSEGLLWQDI